MKQSVSIEWQWPMGHRLQDHDGKCRWLHGHTYRMVAEFSGAPRETAGAPDRGMLEDFSRLKEWVGAVVQPLDHALMLEAGDPALDSCRAYAAMVEVDFAPTAEYIAAHLLERIAQAVRGPVRCKRVTVWESPQTSASAEVDD